MKTLKIPGWVKTTLEDALIDCNDIDPESLPKLSRDLFEIIEKIGEDKSQRLFQVLGWVTYKMWVIYKMEN